MEALSIPLRAGRFVDARDTGIAPRVALVSESAARRYWPGGNPVGKQIRVHVNESIKAPREIVGIVGDVRIRGLEVEPVPVIYVPHAQYGPETMTIVARTAGDPLQALPELKAILKSVGPGVAISRPRTAEDLIAESVAEPRFRTLLQSIFAMVSLSLAAVGLYGVVAFSVNQRRGARPADGARRQRRRPPAGPARRDDGSRPVSLIGLGGAAILAR